MRALSGERQEVEFRIKEHEEILEKLRGGVASSQKDELIEKAKEIVATNRAYLERIEKVEEKLETS